MTKPIRISRTEDELIEALSDNLGILGDAINKVQSGDFKFVKTIKGSLRILVHKGGTNTPLLSALAEKYSITPIIRTEGPFGIRERSLDSFLEEAGIESGTENFILKNRDLIAKGSQQEGGSHEDWAIDKDYRFARADGLLIGGLPVLTRKFIGLGKCIHTAGKKVLEEIKTVRGGSKS